MIDDDPVGLLTLGTFLLVCILVPLVFVAALLWSSTTGPKIHDGFLPVGDSQVDTTGAVSVPVRVDLAENAP
jgi:hypothetical protein